MRNVTIDMICKEKVISILRNVDEEKLPAVAEALYAGGIRLVEVTFQQETPEQEEEAERAIKALCRQFDGRMLIGAGTVLTEQQVVKAKEAGAQFIISPNMDPSVIRKTIALDMVSIPGAMTCTEILEAHQAGADFVKVFPASVLGTSYMKAIRGPIRHVRLMAVGGIDSKNAAAFLEAGVCGVGVGGKLADAGAIAAGAYEKLTAEARALMAAVHGKK